jgi:ketosteroid isomerase-like protein
MSQEDVEIVRQVYEYGHEVQALFLQGGDVSDHPWLSLWHPECVLQEIAEVPDSATYHGREGVALYFRQLGELWEELRMTPVEVIDGPGGVLAVMDMHTRSKAGVPTNVRVFQVFRLRDKQIVHAAGYLDRKQALEAAGLVD